MSYQPADPISRGALREEISNELSPQVQLEFPYGFMSQQVIVSSGAIGDVFTASGVAVCRTGNSANSYANLISYQRARHQAGQGRRRAASRSAVHGARHDPGPHAFARRGVVVADQADDRAQVPVLRRRAPRLRDVL